MKHFLLTLLLLPCWSVSAGQTNFYIDQIQVQPGTPTTADQVNIALIGGLASTGAYITNATPAVNGFTVTLAVTAVDDVGGAVIVPHTEVIPVGMLPAGNYSIVIDGTYVADLAMEADHFFTVSGGSPCDDVDIDYVQWTPFSDTALIVHVFNNSTVLFDYPGFVLLGSNGDTLAIEVVNFFGIGQENYHTLRIRPGVDIPVGLSSVSLHLWTGFFNEMACSWDLMLDLCPPAPCDTLFAALQNFGGGLTIGNFDWTIYDENLELVESGVFEFTDIVQFDLDTICLPPGRYSMTCTTSEPFTGGQPYFGVQTFGWIGGPQLPLAPEIPQVLEFDFNLPCVDGDNAINDTELQSGVRITTGTYGIDVERLDGRPIGPIEVFDPQGRILHSQRSSSSHSFVPLRGSTSGMTIISAAGEVHRLPPGIR